MSLLHADDRGVIVPCPSCGTKNRLPFDRLTDTTRCGKCQAPLAAPAGPVDVDTMADFDTLVARVTLPVLADFWAAWCGPCRAVAPELEKVAARNAGRWLVVKIDTELLPDLAQRLGIRSIPTLAVFAGGREAARTSGSMAAERIETFVQQSISA